MVKTRIICTIGPASSNRTVLRKMMLAGMDVVRLNFSHGSHSEHSKCIRTIKELNKKYHRKIRILQDLEGYRIRDIKKVFFNIKSNNNIKYIFYNCWNTKSNLIHFIIFFLFSFSRRLARYILNIRSFWILMVLF